MTALELKLPPPVVFLVSGLAMWGLAKVWPVTAFDGPWRQPLAIVLAASGALLGLASVFCFWKARTTADPRRPHEASAFVCSGPYRLSRNPMYVCLLIWLLAWGFFLSDAVAFVVIPAFVTYLNRFQILPEERALGEKFGPVFDAYKKSVRRWL